jgi:hypothetical protein
VRERRGLGCGAGEGGKDAEDEKEVAKVDREDEEGDRA